MRTTADHRRSVRAGEVRWCDVLVIGAGVAGLVAALDLLDARPGASVVVVDKGTPGSSGSTPLAQGGMAVAVGPGDSPALHAADTIRAGDGLCDERAVGVVAAEAPARVQDLIARGARFDRDRSGALALAREGGQTVARSVRAADATGAEIFRVLRAAATGRVTRLQGIACGLATAPDHPGQPVAGAWVLLDETADSALGPAQERGLALVRARATLLATGGGGGLYAGTTNRDGATADGIALAHRAGVHLRDLEFVQFHPTGLRPTDPASFQRFLLTEALRGAGAVLIDAQGRRFMPERHPDAELAPRHVVTKAILDQPGGAWLDATGIRAEILATEFPTVLAGARRHGYDLAREPVPVEPCEHYVIGGVATDLDARTSAPGLWAAGEVACAGVHGANRLAGNSLTQSCVFAHRAALNIARALDGGLGSGELDHGPPPALADTSADPQQLAELRAELRRCMSAGVGPIRDGGGLAAAEHRLGALRNALGPVPGADRAAVELDHLLTAGGLIVRSARLRTESRGVHWREDAPRPSPAWADVHLAGGSQGGTSPPFRAV